MPTKILGLSGFSGSGKTTLMCAILPLIIQQGFRVSTLKHAHHRFDIDEKGKDSFRHRESGANQVMIASDSRWALMNENHDQHIPPLDQLLQQMSPVDFVLIEGFKKEPFPKILIHRQKVNDAVLDKDWHIFQNVLAMATDQPKEQTDFCQQKNIDCLALDDHPMICRYIIDNALPIDRFFSQYHG